MASYLIVSHEIFPHLTIQNRVKTMSLNVCAMRDGKEVASITLESSKGKITGLTVRYEASIALPYYSTLDYLMTTLPDGTAYQLDSNCFDVIPESNRENVVFSYLLDDVSDKQAEREAARQFVSELETLKEIADVENLPLVIS